MGYCSSFQTLATSILIISLAARCMLDQTSMHFSTSQMHAFGKCMAKATESAKPARAKQAGHDFSQKFTKQICNRNLLLKVVSLIGSRHRAGSRSTKTQTRHRRPAKPARAKQARPARARQAQRDF